MAGSFSYVKAEEEKTYKKEKYTLENKITNKTGTVTACINEDGILLLPVKEIVESAGYVFEECSRCGKDEVYNKKDESAGDKGHYFVNWYQALLSYSVSSQTVELSAENEKIEGVTYGPLDLFASMALPIEVNDEKKILTISSDMMQAVYFYSSTCNTCEKIEEYLGEIEKKYPNLNIRKYDILEGVVNHDLLMEYGKTYNLPEEQRGFTPSIFISDQVLLGEEIRTSLEERIAAYSEGPATTILRDAKEGTGYEDKSIWAQMAAAFGFGLVNGLSPCSLSFFLFLLSLLLASKETMFKCGIRFLEGKAIMFFLLGTLLYSVISKLNATSFDKWLDLIMIVFAIVFAVLNIIDFFKARAEKYGEMNLQLPSKVKSWNHTLLKWGNKFTTEKYGPFVMFIIGMIVATGEFLCTGQIYLSSVVIMVQKGTQGNLPLGLLAIYSVAFVLPLLILMLIVYFGKKIFGMSEAVLEKIPWIKLISAVLFVAMAVYLVFV